MSNKGSNLINAQNRDMMVKELEKNVAQVLADVEMIQAEVKELLELKKIFDQKYSLLAALMPFPEGEDLMPRLKQVALTAENLISQLTLDKILATDQPCQEANIHCKRCNPPMADVEPDVVVVDDGWQNVRETKATRVVEIANKRKERRCKQENKRLTRVYQTVANKLIEKLGLEDALSKEEDALSKEKDALSKEEDALSKEEDALSKEEDALSKEEDAISKEEPSD